MKQSQVYITALIETHYVDLFKEYGPIYITRETQFANAGVTDARGEGNLRRVSMWTKTTNARDKQRSAASSIIVSVASQPSLCLFKSANFTTSARVKQKKVWCTMTLAASSSIIPKQLACPSV